MSKRTTANIALGIGFLASVILVVALTDLAQWMYLTYGMTFTVWQFKWLIGLIAIAGLGAGAYLHSTSEEGMGRIRLGAISFVGVFFTVMGLFLHTNILFGAQPLLTQTRYVDFLTADEVLASDDEVIVIEVNGAAVAFPDKFIINPHVAGVEIGGKKLTMTYCGLSHLGQAFVPENPDELPNWGVMTNWANNLVMYDRKSGEPIQQITGTAEYTDRTMDHYPTFRLTYENFKRAYPDGEVYYNPLKEFPWYRKLAGVPFETFAGPVLRLNRDPSTNAMAFPIDDNDTRLHRKDQVYAMTIGDENIVYTLDFIMENDGIVHATAGGRNIVIAYDEEFDTVGAFYTDSKVSSVDAYGNSEAGKLSRVETFQSEVLWGVWQHFMTDTIINPKST